jgi:hypothetical protein
MKVKRLIISQTYIILNLMLGFPELVLFCVLVHIREL